MTSTTLKPVLLIGQNPDVMRPFPLLFKRMGAQLTVFSLTKAFHSQDRICTVKYFDDERLLLQALRVLDINTYSIVILADDETIRFILQSDLADGQKRGLLPVISSKYWPHLNSKIGLSKFLLNSSISYPPSLIAYDVADMEEGARAIGFPLLIKEDISSGGKGVYECQSYSQLYRFISRLRPSPLLMQKMIPGKCVDLSGFFRNGKLLYFTYSEFKRTAYSKFGPSILRTYHQAQYIDPLIANELRDLGHALGLNGFANISCIQAIQDDKRYYFEVDARPNAWIDFGKYIGDDFAPVLTRYLKTGLVTSNPVQGNDCFPSRILIPNFLRLSLWEIVSNRYDCWRYIEQIRFSEIILYNVLRRTVGWIESQSVFKLLFRDSPAIENKVDKLYGQLKRKAIDFF